jgi:hypothetical protein
MVRSIGADRVTDYTQNDFTQSAERYDIILDCVGNPSLFARRLASQVVPGASFTCPDVHILHQNQFFCQPRFARSRALWKTCIDGYQQLLQFFGFEASRVDLFWLCSKYPRTDFENSIASCVVVSNGVTKTLGRVSPNCGLLHFRGARP